MNADVDPEGPLARQILLIDTVATRYHCLPSMILREGDTFDVFISNAALEIHQYHQQCMEAEREGKAKPHKQLSQQEMIAMIEGVKKRKKDERKKNK